MIRVGSLPGFKELPSPREGYKMLFRGFEPDPTGEPTDNYVEADLIVPPLSFHSVRAMRERQKARGSQSTQEQLQDDGIETICLSLARNYRGVPRWLVEQSIDDVLMTAIMAKFREMARAAEEKKVPATAS